MIYAVFLYALLDYFGYNLSKTRELKQPIYYTVLLGCLWVVTVYVLYRLDENPIGFIILWWTFSCDWVYYLIAVSLGSLLENRWPRFEGYQGVRLDFDNGINHAFWTPYGIVSRKEIVPVWILILQSIIGLIVTRGI